MSEAQIALESGQAAVSAIVPKKPGFFSKLGGELGKRLAPHNVAADLLMLSIGGVFGLAVAGVSKWVVQPWQMDRLLQQYGQQLPLAEAMLITKGYAQTDNQAQAIIATHFQKRGWAMPVRYAHFQAPQPVVAAPPTAQPPAPPTTPPGTPNGTPTA